MCTCSYMHTFFQTPVCTIINIFTYAAAAFCILVFLGLIETISILSASDLYSRSSVSLLSFSVLGCYICILFL